MARMPHNIEKSAFRPGTYVGYGGGKVWRISRTNSSYGNWVAVAQLNAASGDNGRTPDVYAMRLADMGDKLAALSGGRN